MDQLSKTDTDTIIAAYNSSNSALFALTLQSFNISHDDAIAFCEKYIGEQINCKYSNLSFSKKKKLKMLHVQLLDDEISSIRFQREAKITFDVITNSNVQSIINLISADDAGLYPNAASYINRDTTKRPKNMKKELHVLYPNRMDAAHGRLRRKCCYQMNSELNSNINNYKLLITNEYVFRVEINKFIDNFDDIFNKIQIKARKVESLQTIISRIKGKNKGRDLDLRCDDMISIELSLKGIKIECNLKLKEVQQRAVNLAIAKWNGDDIEIKESQRVFGAYKPIKLFTEYRLMIIAIKTKLNNVNEMIATLQDIDISGLLGNVTKANRAKKAQQRRDQNTKSEADRRKKNKKIIHKSFKGCMQVMTCPETDINQKYSFLLINISSFLVVSDIFPLKVSSKLMNKHINYCTQLVHQSMLSRHISMKIIFEKSYLIYKGLKISNNKQQTENNNELTLMEDGDNNMNENEVTMDVVDEDKLQKQDKMDYAYYDMITSTFLFDKINAPCLSVELNEKELNEEQLKIANQLMIKR